VLADLDQQLRDATHACTVPGPTESWIRTTLS
jgi:hypothetical protein